VKEVLEKYKHFQLKLVKDDNFVIYGEIIEVFDDCIEFLTDGRTIILSFDGIKEVVPLRRGGH